jgi:hypothetical protein
VKLTFNHLTIAGDTTRSCDFRAARTGRTALSSANAITGVADDMGNVHTSAMTLKNAALLVFIGTILMTALLLWTFLSNLLNVLRDLVPTVTLFSSFIYAFGCFSLAVFFYIFHRRQS